MPATNTVVFVARDGTVWVRASVNDTVTERYSEQRVRRYMGILFDVHGERDCTGINT